MPAGRFGGWAPCGGIGGNGMPRPPGGGGPPGMPNGGGGMPLMVRGDHKKPRKMHTGKNTREWRGKAASSTSRRLQHRVCLPCVCVGGCD